MGMFKQILQNITAFSFLFSIIPVYDMVRLS